MRSATLVTDTEKLNVNLLCGKTHMLRKRNAVLERWRRIILYPVAGSTNQMMMWRQVGIVPLRIAHHRHLLDQAGLAKCIQRFVHGGEGLSLIHI